MRQAPVVLLVSVIVMNCCGAVRADQTVPATSATPAVVATPQPPPAIPANFDPCAGPAELFNKIGNGTACVLVLGEVTATASYTTINVPANAVLTGQFGRNIALSGQANAYSYPDSTIYVGTGPRSQFSYTPLRIHK